MSQLKVIAVRMVHVIINYNSRKRISEFQIEIRFFCVQKVKWNKKGDLAMGLKLLFIFFVGAFLLGTGARIWKKQLVSFVAGYGEFYHPTNEPVLAKRIGMIVMALGIETWILLPLALYFPNFEAYIYGIIAFLHVMTILLLIAIDQLSG